MRVQDFRGNCDSQGKLGMCPSLAEPDSIDIPKNTNPKRNTKIPLLSKSRGIFSISV